MEIYLETDRLILRQFEQKDSAFLAELDSDPEVMRFLNDGLRSDDVEIARATNVMLETRKRHNGRLGYFIAQKKNSSEAIGWFHLRPLKEFPHDETRLELGYRLKRKFWGKGYGSEASRALMDRGFGELAADEIWACAMKANQASQNIMKKMGMDLIRTEIYEPWPGEDKECVWYMAKKPAKNNAR